MSADLSGDARSSQDRILWAAMLIGAAVYPLVLIALSLFLPTPAPGSAGSWLVALGLVAALPSLILRRLPSSQGRAGAGGRADPRSGGLRRARMLLGVALAEIPAAISIVSYLLGASLRVGLVLCALSVALVFFWRPSAD